MGKKQKDAQRTKGNVKPASSWQTSELLGSVKGAGFVGFDTMCGDLGFVPSVQSSDTAEDGAFRLVLKKMTKRDTTTKLKAVQEFTALCLEKEEATVLEALPFWPRVYGKLVLEYDRRVREAAQHAHVAVVSRANKKLAPYLKQLMGPWILAMADKHQATSAAASTSFSAAFTLSKQREAVGFCAAEVRAYLYDLIVTSTPGSLSDERTTPAHEMEEKYVQVVSGALLSILSLLSLVHRSSHEHVLAPLLNQLFSEAKYWKLARHDSPMMMTSFYIMLSGAIQYETELCASKLSKIVPLTMGRLSTCVGDATGGPSVWAAAVDVATYLKDCWSLVNINKALLPAFARLANQGGAGQGSSNQVSAGQGSSRVQMYFVPLVAQFPREILESVELVDKLIANRTTGLWAVRASFDVSEVSAVIQSYFDLVALFVHRNPASAMTKHIMMDKVGPLIAAPMESTDSERFKTALQRCLSNFLFSLAERAVTPEASSASESLPSAASPVGSSVSSSDETRSVYLSLLTGLVPFLSTAAQSQLLTAKTKGRFFDQCSSLLLLLRDRCCSEQPKVVKGSASSQHLSAGAASLNESRKPTMKAGPNAVHKARAARSVSTATTPAGALLLEKVVIPLAVATSARCLHSNGFSVRAPEICLPSADEDVSARSATGDGGGGDVGSPGDVDSLVTTQTTTSKMASDLKVLAHFLLEFGRLKTFYSQLLACFGGESDPNMEPSSVSSSSSPSVLSTDNTLQIETESMSDKRSAQKLVQKFLGTIQQLVLSPAYQTEESVSNNQTEESVSNNQTEESVSKSQEASSTPPQSATLLVECVSSIVQSALRMPAEDDTHNYRSVHRKELSEDSLKDCTGADNSHSCLVLSLSLAVLSEVAALIGSIHSRYSHGEVSTGAGVSSERLAPVCVGSVAVLPRETLGVVSPALEHSLSDYCTAGRVVEALESVVARSFEPLVLVQWGREQTTASKMFLEGVTSRLLSSGNQRDSDGLKVLTGLVELFSKEDVIESTVHACMNYFNDEDRLICCLVEPGSLDLISALYSSRLVTNGDAALSVGVELFTLYLTSNIRSEDFRKVAEPVMGAILRCGAEFHKKLCCVVMEEVQSATSVARIKAVVRRIVLLDTAKTGVLPTEFLSTLLAVCERRGDSGKCHPDLIKYLALPAMRGDLVLNYQQQQTPGFIDVDPNMEMSTLPTIVSTAVCVALIITEFKDRLLSPLTSTNDEAEEDDVKTLVSDSILLSVLEAHGFCITLVQQIPRGLAHPSLLSMLEAFSSSESVIRMDTHSECHNWLSRRALAETGRTSSTICGSLFKRPSLATCDRGDLTVKDICNSLFDTSPAVAKRLRDDWLPDVKIVCDWLLREINQLGEKELKYPNSISLRECLAILSVVSHHDWNGEAMCAILNVLDQLLAAIKRLPSYRVPFESEEPTDFHILTCAAVAWFLGSVARRYSSYMSVLSLENLLTLCMTYTEAIVPARQSARWCAHSLFVSAAVQFVLDVCETMNPHSTMSPQAAVTDSDRNGSQSATPPSTDDQSTASTTDSKPFGFYQRERTSAVETLLPDWAEFFSENVYKVLLPVFVEYSAGMSSLSPVSARWLTSALSRSVTFAPSPHLSANHLPLRLIPSQLPKGELSPPVESALNRLTPLLLGTSPSVQVGAFIALQRLIPAVARECESAIGGGSTSLSEELSTGELSLLPPRTLMATIDLCMDKLCFGEDWMLGLSEGVGQHGDFDGRISKSGVENTQRNTEEKLKPESAESTSRGRVVAAADLNMETGGITICKESSDEIHPVGADENVAVVAGGYSESMMCVRAYFLCWRVVLKFLQYSSDELRAQYIAYLKTHSYAQHLITTVFDLLRTISRSSPALTPGGAAVSTSPATFQALKNPLLNMEECLPLSELVSLSGCLYYETLTVLPAVVRQVWGETDKKTSGYIDTFTRVEISPHLTDEELVKVERGEEDAENLKVRVRRTAKEVVAVYSVEEFSVDLVILLPANFPLGLPSVDCQKKLGVPTSEWRKWMLQLTSFLSYQNGSILNAIKLWRRSLDRKFGGVEECYICFSVLHGSSLQLPKQQCKTCHKRFHSSCLYKWFTSSQKSTCPMCRNLW